MDWSMDQYNNEQKSDRLQEGSISLPDGYVTSIELKINIDVHWMLCINLVCLLCVIKQTDQ